MKTLVPAFAMALTLAFTGPAFAGDVTKATDKASCDKVAACGMPALINAQRKAAAAAATNTHSI